MRLNARNMAIIAGVSALTAGAIIFAVNNKVGGLDKYLGKSGWF
ncbi:hypothetical protein OPW41_00100 [Vibrio europaeus]|jgi:uncharacterized membrane protein YhiD involved in acid resistance|nr:hypothetical protein [Vibrio europaeus]MDC5758021.1 hypothetical protein [Vibrio europaeus]MDC5773585.1 hypothetical protein [Vibrio europaeus]MDC5793221.1 hypothetical protein [Vibrio europaeus]MDC5802714.1 hypothetical protein [Vibrio europaeus]MDC5814642.1 hypothetical protein [Vibrio europaeus]